MGSLKSLMILRPLALAVAVAAVLTVLFVVGVITTAPRKSDKQKKVNTAFIVLMVVGAVFLALLLYGDNKDRLRVNRLEGILNDVARMVNVPLTGA